ncbi:peptide ABC transporter substrate-binding protein [Prosthecobacter sp. SYSU 5D2]|uniref:peptide ABC transporter substrate-binding protein n=1 Tax=Prosthecobacter sp. SYSU 5D2 TaxID=3134134 RepID=UPI0031FEB6CF
MRILSRMLPVAACAVCLGACAPERERADLVFIQSAEPETLDPALTSDQVSMRLSTALFEGLCRVNQAGRPEPGMAERWEISPDRKTYTFHLRAGTAWTDGRAVVAEDFVGSWKRALDPATGGDYASLMHVIRGAKAFSEGQDPDFSKVGVKAVDEKTLRVELENPTPYFVDLTAFVTLAPVPLGTIEKHGTAWIKPANIVTNGAYFLEEWLLDDRIRLRKNPHYWDAANVGMETIEIKPVQDANTALSYFHTGQCDLIMDKGMIPPTLTQKLKQQPWFHTGPFLGTWFIRINVTKPPFDDARVRQAFALAVDKARIVEKITQLGELTAWGLTPPGTGQDYQAPPGLDLNVEEARRLMAEAGYPGGKGFPRVEYLYIPLGVERNIAIELQAMWQEALGVTVNLTKQEQKVWLKSMRELDYHLCRSSWVGDYNDPSTFLDMFITGSGNNRTGWSNEKYDRLVTEAAGEADILKRNAIFQQAEQTLIREESAIIPVYYYVGVQFYHADRLEGVQGNLIDDHPFRCMRWKN